MEDKVAALLRELKSIELKNKGLLLTFWSKQTAVAPPSATFPNIRSVCPSASIAVSDEVKDASDNPSLTPTTATTPVLVKAKVQEALKNEISLINSDLVGLLKRKSLGLWTDSQEDDLKAKNQKKVKLEMVLKKKQDDQKRQKKRHVMKEGKKSYKFVKTTLSCSVS